MTYQKSTYMLENYKEYIKNIKQNAKEMNISDQEINKMFKECFDLLEKKSAKKTNRLCFGLVFIFKLFVVFTLIFLSIFILLNHHQPTLSLVLRNVQRFIHPSLKILRLLAIPIIQVFPRLSELYDETCLIENPYFQVSNMECWPCENVHSVINLTDSKNFSLYQTGIPYIIKTLNNSVHLQDIQEIYKTNSEIFNQDAYRINSNNPQFTTINNLLNFTPNNTDTHISWRINRMAPARIIRSLFPKPFIVSAWSGQSTERYILIDDIKSAPYVLPNPECSFVLLTQGSGRRSIVLKPTRECANNCKVTSVTLKPHYTLVYNWWYWRPISLPNQNPNVSISYMSSFC